MASLTLNGNKFSTLRKHRHCKYLSQSHIQQKSRFRDIYLAGGPVPEGRVSVNYTFLSIISLMSCESESGVRVQKKEAICRSDNFLFSAVSLTIIETYHTTFVNFQTSYIGTNRCSTANLGNGNVYDWIEKIQVRLLLPDFDHSLEQNDLIGHSVGVIF